MNRISFAIAIIAAFCVMAFGLSYGTYAAGGSDSSCYALMADAFARGRLQPDSDLVARAPWPDAQHTFTPGGFVPSPTNPSAFSPICAPGFSLLLAPLATIGRDAMFFFTPVAGALLVWLTFVAARTLGEPAAGAMAAVLIAASPPMLYQVVQPMNDVATAALWMATFVALISRRWGVAGITCGLALLVRPNLLPVAAVCAAVSVTAREAGIGDPRTWIRDRGFGMRNLTRILVAAAPFGLLVLWLNTELYGGPSQTGYGQLGQLFSLSAFSINASRYLGWIVDTHTVFPFLAFAAPLVIAREKRTDAALALALIATTFAIYFFYTPFGEWSYLRFLLPAIALMVVLASVVFVRASEAVVVRYGAAEGPAKAGHYVLCALVTAGLVVFCLRAAEDRLAFHLRFLEQRYRSAGVVVRDTLPPDAVVLSVWDSGAVRFHGRKEALSWEALDPMWLDRSLEWLQQNGHQPYLMLESWEEPAFRRRFGSHSEIGKLDWPPKYEIDRTVRIYDPADRAAYLTGGKIATQYLWPLRR